MIQQYSKYISRISGISDVYVDVGNIKHRYIAGISKKYIKYLGYILIVSKVNIKHVGGISQAYKQE